MGGTIVYNKLITRKYSEISKFYNIYGKDRDGWVNFIPGTIYSELVIQKKL
jgi:hypothetical protein